MLARIVLVLILAKYFSSPAYAGAVPYAGVWAGEIGSQSVRVCFTVDDSQYYYSKHMNGIRLLIKPCMSRVILVGLATQSLSNILIDFSSDLEGPREQLNLDRDQMR
jgi:hypothetical protein